MIDSASLSFTNWLHAVDLILHEKEKTDLLKN